MSEMSEVESKQEPQFAAFVGIDWADEKHAWCLQSAGSEKRESEELEHTPEAVEAWVSQLCQRFGDGPIAVAVEQSRGALVFMLSKYEPLHLFPVPSTMSASMRKAPYPSGSEDDPRDADLLLDLLLQHRDKLRRLSPDTEATRRIQNLAEERRKLVDEKTAQTNRLTGDLKIYFPHMLDWFERLDTELVCALLERWPTLEELQKVPPAQLRTFLHKHHCRDQELIERRILAIRKAIPAIRDRAVIEAKGMVVKVIVQVLLADAYGVVAGNAIARAGCWSHYARRKFVDAEKTAPEIAREVVALLRTLFAIEKQAREASASERLEIRQKRPPVIRDTRQAEFPERPPRGVTVRRGDVLNQRKPQSGIPHP